VVNAGCADKDIAHINKHLKEFRTQGRDVSMEIFSEQNSLIAVQGPATEKLLQNLVEEDLTKMEFMTQRLMNVNSIPCIVTRCGYTGEDGFEISVPSKKAVALATTFLDTAKTGAGIKPTGLGARDSLRLEAGLCLYGHDLNEDISPIESALAWLIGKRRREQGGFIGSDIILRQLKEGVAKKRVGLIVKGAPAREDVTIHNNKGEEIGKVTSGTFSPVLKQAIAMGYVKSEYSKVDTPVLVKVRGKDQSATISKMPFVPTHYKKSEEKK
jgi:aminomethyltransferase